MTLAHHVIFAGLAVAVVAALLARRLYETEFLSPYGIRSLSKFHERHPYVFPVYG
jgi:glycogen debranching enzyme